MILRISNLFGPHHFSSNNGIINIAIRKSFKDEVINIIGDGSLQKDFLFIRDFVKIYWALINNSKANNAIVNVGSGHILSITSILNIIKLKLPNIQINYLNMQTADNGVIDFSIDRLKSIVQIDFKDPDSAIESTIEWEKLQFKKSNLL
jgi:UDP-glucose 4-epimerase